MDFAAITSYLKNFVHFASEPEPNGMVQATIKETLSQKSNSNSASLFVTAVLIYPGGMTSPLTFATDQAQQIEQAIHEELGRDASFHLSLPAETPEFEGCHVWHDASLYEEQYLNRLASTKLGLTLYGKVVVVYGSADPNRYQTLPQTMLNTLKHATPPEPQSRPSPRRSTPKKRSRHKSPPPSALTPARTDSTQPFSQPSKDSSNNERNNTSKPKIVEKRRRSSRIAEKRGKYK